MRHQLEMRFKAIEAFVNDASTRQIPDQIQSYLFRFGTVLICGNIERSIEIIILDRLADRAQPRVLTFIKSHFTRGTNFDCAAIEQLLARFDAEWYRRFCAFVESNPDVKEGVSSCYAVRNSVAHGGTMSVGIRRLRELLELSQRLIEGVIQATT